MMNIGKRERYLVLYSSSKKMVIHLKDIYIYNSYNRYELINVNFFLFQNPRKHRHSFDVNGRICFHSASIFASLPTVRYHIEITIK